MSLPNSSFVAGNTVQPIYDAAGAYPVMLGAIERAKQSVYLANYCMIQGVAFDRFYTALTEAAKRGVDVRVLLDAYGSKDNNLGQLQSMRAAGVEIAWFQPLQILHPLRYNGRLHKKLLIVDNKIGFTGGVGVGDYWLQHPNYPTGWHDTHFQLEGPVVVAMTKAFASSWDRWGSSPIPLAKIAYAAGKPKEGVEIAAIDSLPVGPTQMAPIGQTLLALIRNARHDLTITSGYLGPDRKLAAALCQAASRGVRVRVLTNSIYSTHHSVLEAGKQQYAKLLRGGIEIYEYLPTMVHSKLMIIDGQISSVGSANLNYRSLYHNQEFNVVVRDATLATELNKAFERDLKKSHQIKLEGWQRRPATAKIRQAIDSLGRYLF